MEEEREDTLEEENIDQTVLVHLMPHHHPVFSLSLEKSFLLWPKSIVHKANNEKG